MHSSPRLAALLPGAAALALLTVACAGAPRASEPRDTTYVYLTLKTGGAEKTPAERQELFKGHMANMKRLADAGKLLICGPFDKPAAPAKGWACGCLTRSRRPRSRPRSGRWTPGRA